MDYGYIRLGVNVDHVATLRQARLTNYPDPVEAAMIALDAGADLITVHLREDRRHIQDDDVYVMRRLVPYLNLEMSVNEDIVKIAEGIVPDCCTLVPERREELTTEGGLDVVGNFERIKEVIDRLFTAGVKKVSLFIEADKKQIGASQEAGATAVELHTGRYADTRGKEQEKELERIKEAAYFAAELGLEVAAGHGLNYENVVPIAKIYEIEELNIGHSIVAAAVIEGMASAVWRMKSIMLASRGGEDVWNYWVRGEKISGSSDFRGVISPRVPGLRFSWDSGGIE